MWPHVLAVGLGGALGSVLRFAVARALPTTPGSVLPKISRIIVFATASTPMPAATLKQSITHSW